MVNSSPSGPLTILPARCIPPSKFRDESTGGNAPASPENNSFYAWGRWTVTPDMDLR